MKRMIDAEKFLDKLLYMGYMDEEKSEVEDVANIMTEDAYTKDEVTAMLKELEKEIDGEAWTRVWSDERIVEMESVSKIIQQKIYKMEE